MVPLLLASALLALVHHSSAAEICCPDVGCFNDATPFNQLPLPDCPASFALKYTMYTRTNRINGQVFTHTTVPNAYVSSRRTVFMTHGWNQNGGDSFLTDMKNAFLDREDINAVIVDWGGGAQVLNYNKASSNTRSVGAYTALVFQRLLQVSGSQSARMWCAGHSLGSHVCGHTGMKMPTNQRLGRITGMDPAGPNFETNSDKRIGLNPTAATFVDILHTDSDELGTRRDIGHVDFYPSGGADQPGCILRDFFRNEDVEMWDDETPVQYSLCSHARSNLFLTESIKRDCFHATRVCTDYNRLPASCSTCTGCGAFPCSYMGYGADSACRKTGIFYLTVTSRAPYCSN
jgi:hypothetical protein